MKKIVVSEFYQETNSFNPITTKLEDFEQRTIYEGDELLNLDGPRTIAGIFKAIIEEDGEIIPACSMVSQSGGIVEQTVLNLFLDKTISTIKESFPIDGVFLSLHGATQATECDDACGYIVETIRKVVGDSVVISIAADLHANVTEKFFNNSNIVCGYQTYPHIDFFETGYRSSRLGMNCLEGEKVYQARFAIPMIFPASGYTSEEGRFKNILSEAKRLIDENDINDFSIFQMQPWLDVESAAGSVIIVIGSDNKKIGQIAKQIGFQLHDARSQFSTDLFSIDEVIKLAAKNKSGKPVVLVDFADSSNAGSTGDSAAVLEKLIINKPDIKSALIVNDVIAVEKAFKIGVGQKGMFSVGGTKNPNLFNAFQVEAKVKSLHEGIFILEGPSGRGMEIDIGPTAVISAGKADIVLCHCMSFNGDPQIFRGFGVEPTFYDLVAVKACTSFRAAYQQFTDLIFLTDTPGAAAANIEKLPYKNLSKSFYPFSELENIKNLKIMVSQCWKSE